MGYCFVSVLKTRSSKYHYILIQFQQTYNNNNNNNYNHPNRQPLSANTSARYVKSVPPNPDRAFKQLSAASKIPPSHASNISKNNPMQPVLVTKNFNNWESAMDNPDDPDIETLTSECGIDEKQCSGLWMYVGPKPLIPTKISKGEKTETLYYVPDGDDVEDIMNKGLDTAGSYATNFPFFNSVSRAIQVISNDAQDDNNNITIFYCEVTLDQIQQNALSQTHEVTVTDIKKIEFLAAAAVNINILRNALKL